MIKNFILITFDIYINLFLYRSLALHTPPCPRLENVFEIVVSTETHHSEDKVKVYLVSGVSALYLIINYNQFCQRAEIVKISSKTSAAKSNYKAFNSLSFVYTQYFFSILWSNVSQYWQLQVLMVNMTNLYLTFFHDIKLIRNRISVSYDCRQVISKKKIMLSHIVMEHQQ